MKEKKLTKNGTIAREAPIMFRIPKHKTELQKRFDKAVKNKTKSEVIVSSLEKTLK